ncbi:MAG: hypothetical protein AUJ85_04850 [Elusimicrobia bacterium CG1_02_37_114]|nr:MAG: hypothetical protein AUJ85_04850 [Elusimicrobia bacterium CG1_02_37_114]
MKKIIPAETKKRINQIETLFEISKAIVSDKYVNEVLGLIVNIIAKTMNSKICSILLLDEKKQELFIVATQSLSEGYIKKPNLKIGQGISGIVVKGNRPVMSIDVTKDKRYMYPEIVKKEGIVSMLSVPIAIKGRVVGVINNYTPQRHKFTDKEIKLLQTISGQAALAIENSKLMNELVSTRELLQTRKSVERAKGILMRELSLNEEDAYRVIQKKSMDSSKPMKEIAEAIILTYELKKQV